MILLTLLFSSLDIYTRQASKIWVSINISIYLNLVLSFYSNLKTVKKTLEVYFT